MQSVKQVVIITGGSSGIGLELALQYTQSNYIVVIIGRNQDKLDDAVQKMREYNGQVYAYKADICSQLKIKGIVEEVYGLFKRIDILINCAGVMKLSFIHEGKVDEWSQMMNTNFMGVVNCTTAVLPYMRENNSGHIINIGSIFSYTTEVYGVIYSATKHAVKAFTEGIRKELKYEKKSIYVSLISPGPVETNLVKQTKYKVEMLSAKSVADIVFKITVDDSFRNITELVVKP